MSPKDLYTISHIIYIVAITTTIKGDKIMADKINKLTCMSCGATINVSDAELDAINELEIRLIGSVLIAIDNEQLCCTAPNYMF